jgi:hypothetical protein
MDKSLPKHAQDIFTLAHDSALNQYKEENKANQVAWAAVKNKYKNGEAGWEKKSDEPFLLWSEPFEVKSDGGKYYVKGYISCEGIDLVNDYVTKECLEDMVTQIKDRSVSIKLGKDHEHVLDDPRIMPLAKIETCILDTKGVLADIRVNDAHPYFENTWKSIQNGFYDSFSIEFRPLSYKNEIKGDKQVRRLDKVFLGGVTFTGRPVCPACKITDTFIKSLAVKGDNINEFSCKIEKIGDNMDEIKTALVPEVKAEEIKEVKKEEVKVEPVKEETKAETIDYEKIKALIREEIKVLQPTPKVLVTPDEKPLETKSEKLSFRIEDIALRQMRGK